MLSCSSSEVLIVKNNKFNKFQYFRDEIEKNQMKDIPYTFLVGSLCWEQSLSVRNIDLPLKIANSSDDVDTITEKKKRNKKI